MYIHICIDRYLVGVKANGMKDQELACRAAGGYRVGAWANSTRRHYDTL
jgi:hypothetical protein